MPPEKFDVEWTESALFELRDIIEYIELSNSMAAEQLAKLVFQRTEQLEQFPESCPVVDELPELNYRQLLVGPIRLIYQIEKQNVMMLHVVRQEREISRFLME